MLTCTNKVVRVYQADLVKAGHAHALFAVYQNLQAMNDQLPPLYKDEIEFTFDYLSVDDLYIQAENAIKNLAGFSSCTN